jgi:hypothetical protein
VTDWASPTEAAVYEAAAYDNPRGANEGPMAYILRLADIAQAELTKREERRPKPPFLATDEDIPF